MGFFSNLGKIFSLHLIFEAIYIVLYAWYAYIHLIFRLIIKPKLKSLDDEVFLITGSASGIGREVAFHLAKHHPKTTLVLWDFSEKANEETFEGVKLLGVKVFSYTVDVTDRKQVERTAQKVFEDVGEPVSILFNNAGVAGLGDLLTQSPEKIEKTIQVNLISHFWTLRAFLPGMIDNNHGHIVTTCSGAGYHGVRGDAPYSASKFGVRGYLDSLKNEIRHHPLQPDIKFTTIFPAFVRTPLTSRVRVQMKLPFFQTFMEPRYVAERIVDGIRRNQENVFLPKILEFFFPMNVLLPKKLINVMEDSYIEKLSFAEEKHE